ncbi:gamma-glutamyltranspeptidase/glutathione hydrolase [Actinocorallia herbida]|uniref:Gamma-glutamyltranspeptidase/glutathione hydrolase n=1 Tax=Actinocorallia herbida TaxID=58109 RepID=A0A3N1CZF0_9ACTN|nr:gamma-glutamyltransferase [Actinocorallia herbida]ROO86649.1 gamma-glutamyltranspeptidase/glutathione hydrolase [Actinocorallia herbida]
MTQHTELARRAVASGTLGAVAAGARPAAAIGTAILLQGGNAYDAAVAAALAETVLLPSKCGPAGDVVALHLGADADRPASLISVGKAPARLYGAAEATGWAPCVTGPLSVGVPGAPAGYSALAARGRLGLAALTRPAIDLARRGIIWSSVNRRLVAESLDVLTEWQPQGTRYSPTDGPLPLGSRVRLPGLADVLTEFADRGAELFTGALGERVVAYVTGHGGVVEPADLRPVPPLETPAGHAPIDGTDVWATPAPTYGPALLAALAEGGAPEAVRAALAGLRAPTGLPPALVDGTSTVAAADAEGNLVVLVHSNSFPRYGSGLVVPGLDLVLSNRAGRGFTFLPGHPNAPLPGSRPPTTLHAWAAKDSSGAWVLGATPGGEQQVPWNTQTLRRLLDLPPDLAPDLAPAALATALAAPRWEFTASGDLLREGDRLPEFGARSAHTIVRRDADGTLTAVADPRQDTAAVAL